MFHAIRAKTDMETAVTVVMIAATIIAVIATTNTEKRTRVAGIELLFRYAFN